jgi:large conductance mechanosensitive channel
MLKGFRDFILRGNVLDLAVAVVIGAAFSQIINAIVAGFVTPLIALLGGAPNASALNTESFLWGDILNAIINFLITAAVVYFFIVMPANRLMARLKPAPPEPQKTRPCPECLSAIPVAAKRCSFCTAVVNPVTPAAPEGRTR